MTASLVVARALAKAALCVSAALETIAGYYQTSGAPETAYVDLDALLAEKHLGQEDYSPDRLVLESDMDLPALPL